MATNEKRRDKVGDFQDVTTWFRVTLWGKQAETASKYLTKGSPVYIEGRLRIEEWTDRDGQTRQSLEVNATDMQFISGGSRADDAGAGGSAQSDYYEKNDFQSADEPTGAPAASDDDIPF